MNKKDIICKNAIMHVFNCGVCFLKNSSCKKQKRLNLKCLKNSRKGINNDK